MTDRELLGSYVSGGSGEAFTEIVSRHTGKVFGVCLRILGDRHAAEDAAQAVFLVLARKARKISPKASLSGWLFITARQVALRHRQGELRRQKREREAADMREAAAGGSSWEAVSPHVDEAMAKLPARQRDALVAHYLDGKTQAEVAAVMNCNSSTAGTWISRGLAALRARLARRGVAVPAAALGALLAENLAAEAPAGLAAAVSAACLGGVPSSSVAASLAEGVMKSMFWTKVKIAAVAVVAAVAVGGGGAVALRELNAAENGKGRTAAPKFPLNPKVAAMKENTWIKLPTPKKHPICRSSSPWMAYVPEAGVGILWGCSHSGHHNDVWTYNLATNTWTEALKTEPSAARDPGVLKYKDGLLMTRLGRPLSYHQWGFMDYDPDRKVLWHRGGHWQGVYSVAGHYKKIGKTITQEGDPEKHKQFTQKGPYLWQYSPEANKWKVVYTLDPSRCTRYKGYIRYFPPLKKLIMTPKWVTPNEDRENYKIYDPSTNKWEWLKVTWKPLPGEKISKYWSYGHAPIVYDAKRKVLVHVFSSGGVWLLDPVKKTMTQIIAKDKSLPANLDGPMGAYVYDSAAGRVLGVFANYTAYNSGKVLKARGFPTDRANIWALDVEKKKWVLQPKPVDGVMPPLNSLGSLHHFHDPVQNATFIFRGGYNRTGGECWVYRCKRRQK